MANIEILLDPSLVKARQRRSFSLAEKMKILDRMAKGQSATKIARDYNVNESTIRHMRKQEATIRLAANSMTSKVASGSKRNRNLQMSKMEACLTTWLDDIRAKRLPVWHGKVKSKALQLYDLIGKHELFESVGFAASTGWFERFKRKYDLFELRPHEERPPPSEVEFKTTMKSALTDGHITPGQIFTVETSMFHWKLLPGVDTQEKAMMLFSCDASGNFFTPPILFRDKSEPATNSVYVKLEKPESITKQDLRDWFYDIFVSKAESFLKASNLPDRAIVLVANDPNHPTDLEHYSFDVATIPPGCNPTCLPTARGILLHFNAVYLKHLSLAMKEIVKKGIPFEEAWENFSIEDTTAILKSTVADLDKRALRNGWSYLLDTPKQDFSNDPILQETVSILQSIGVNDISVRDLREQITPRELTNEEVVEFFMKHQKELEESNFGEPAEATHHELDELDPVERRMLFNEINQHLAALASARKFFEAKDKNKPRSEAISKRLKQVSIWMREMRTEITPTDPDDKIPMDIKIEPLEIEMEIEQLDSD
ncbi:tigger transposable element-derived protein 1-like [Armigeres subalbatus]|uniref:tigger transposable element-derived protein 1-like n=1 Tax=Armigeres subalbatus TaxID=124917 RepID=UPI002ED40154